MIRAALRLLVLLACATTGQARAADTPHVISQIQGDQASQRGFEIVREAYRRVGLDAQAEILPNERGIVSADNGVTDGDTMRMAGLEARYSNLVRVPEPLLTFDTIAFTNGMLFKVDGWESLRPYSLCIIRGMKLAEKGAEGMNREVISDNISALRMLKAGRCEVAVLGEAIWLLIDELKLGPLRALDPAVEVTPLYHYVNRRHAALAPKLAEALKAMRKDGAITSILAADRAAIQRARERNSVRE